MCRLFLSIRNTNTKQKMYDFLNQSTHPKKFTPDIDNHRDLLFHEDGFGFAWFDKKWKIYKNPFVYHEDPNLENRINHMKKEIVIGQIKNNDFAKNLRHDINVHPFIFENHVFVHNGYIDDFKKHRAFLIKHIDQSFLNEICGDTDTEILFFMFLSILKKNKRASLQKSMNELFQIFQKNKIELSANFIYANDKEVLITRYIYYNKKDYKEEQHPPSLYYILKNNQLLISSEPITSEYTIFPENTMTSFDWRIEKEKQKSLSFYKIK
jgi:predicted glutamine amidotransferase